MKLDQLEDELGQMELRADIHDIIEETLDSVGIIEVLLKLITGQYSEKKLYEDLINLTLDIELKLEKEAKYE